MTSQLSERIKRTSRCSKASATNFFDGKESAVEIFQVFSTKEQARNQLIALTEKAKSIETDPCQIHAEIQPIENGFLLQMQIQFCCQAEMMIFQMGLRSS